MISFAFALCGSRLKDLDLISSLGHDEKLGQVVTVHAVVVGDYQEGDNDESHDLKGFFLQEEWSYEDGDSGTSKGIFVYE